jgi:hypothetical protein
MLTEMRTVANYLTLVTIFVRGNSAFLDVFVGGVSVTAAAVPLCAPNGRKGAQKGDSISARTRTCRRSTREEGTHTIPNRDQLPHKLFLRPPAKTTLAEGLN